MDMDHAVALKALVDTFGGDIAAVMRALKDVPKPKVDKHAAVNKSLDNAVAKCDARMSRKMFKKLATAAWDRTHQSSEPKETKPRAPNAWFIFCSENIADVKAKYPALTREERMKILSEMYKASKTTTTTNTTDEVQKRKREPEAFTPRTRRSARGQ